MATFTPFFIPSTTPEKTWQVYCHKPAKRPAYVYACEGACANGIFLYNPYSHRHVMVTLSGRSTSKAIYLAGKELLDQLATLNYINPDAVSTFLPCLVK